MPISYGDAIIVDRSRRNGVSVRKRHVAVLLTPCGNNQTIEVGGCAGVIGAGGFYFSRP